LKCNRSNHQVNGIGASHVRAVSDVEVLVNSRVSDYFVKLICCVLPTIVNDLPSCSVSEKSWNISNELFSQLADPSLRISGAVDLLIGGGVFFDVISTSLPRIPLNVKNVFLNHIQFG